MDKAREKAIRRQTMFWLLAFFVFLFFLWLLGDILLPFIAGMALAYFLDPVADLLERWGVGRLTATTIILLVFVIVFVVTDGEFIYNCNLMKLGENKSFSLFNLI